MMDRKHLENHFARMGARVQLHADDPDFRFTQDTDPGAARLNVLKDREGEFFDIECLRGKTAEISVLDVQPRDRHLLLLVRNGAGTKSKFLCGHDERHWFVAAIPESAPVGTVRQAKEALKPAAVRVRQDRQGLRARQRNRRKNSAYVRQGEWFFLPEPHLDVDERRVIRREPLTRGNGGKPHMAEFCYRCGGTKVYVCRHYPAGVSMDKYQQLFRRDPAAHRWAWRVLVRDPEVYARGRITHPDHKTIVLAGWHRVLMNTEHRAAAMRHVVFLD
jgi:hypothetical protein